MVLYLPYDQVIFAERRNDGSIAVVVWDAVGVEAEQVAGFSVDGIGVIVGGERDDSEVILGQQVAAAVEELLLGPIGAIKLVLDT